MPADKKADSVKKEEHQADCPEGKHMVDGKCVDKEPAAMEEKAGDKVTLLSEAVATMVKENREYGEAFKQMVEMLTGKKTDEKTISPDIAEIKKQIANVQEQIELQKQVKELRAKLAEPAREPRGQPPTVGTVLPLGKSTSLSGVKKLSIKEAAELFIDRANKGVPLSKADWAAAGFLRA